VIVGVRVGVPGVVGEGVLVALAVADGVVRVGVADELGVALGGAVTVNVGVGVRGAVGDLVPVAVSVGDGIDGTREGVGVGVGAPEGLDVATDVKVAVASGVGVGVAEASSTIAAAKSAADTTPSPFTSTSGHWLPSKMASTTDWRSSGSPQSASLAANVVPATGAAAADTISAATIRRAA
jgi:hypothetical protein